MAGIGQGPRGWIETTESVPEHTHRRVSVVEHTTSDKNGSRDAMGHVERTSSEQGYLVDCMGSVTCELIAGTGTLCRNDEPAVRR